MRKRNPLVLCYAPWKNSGNSILNMSLYDLKMANALFKLGMKDMKVVFELSFRKKIGGREFTISLGQEQLVDFLLNYHFGKFECDYLLAIGIDSEFVNYLSTYKWEGSLHCIPEGFFVYPYEPIIRIECDVIGAILIRTNLLQIMESNSFSATQASRIFYNTKHYGIFNPTTDNISADCIAESIKDAKELKYDSPIYYSRSISHTWIELFDTEWDAFRSLADVYPNDVSLLIDTYDIFNSGIINAIKLDDYLIQKYPNNSNKRVKRVLICNEKSSSDTKCLRKILDDSNKSYIRIVVLNKASTNNAEEDQSLSLNHLDMKKNLIFSSEYSVFDSVYNLVAIKNSDGTYTPKAAFSDAQSKSNISGCKNIYRINIGFLGYLSVLDIIAMSDETIEAKTKINLYPIGSDNYIEVSIPARAKVNNISLPYIIDGKLLDDRVEPNNCRERRFYQNIAIQFVYSARPTTLLKNYPYNRVYMTEKVYKTQYDVYKNFMDN